MKAFSVLFLGLLAFSQHSNAQTDYAADRPSNMISAELFGNGIVGSLNYERKLGDLIGLRVGTNGPNSLALVNFYPAFAHVDIGVGAVYSEWNGLFELNNGKKWSPTAAMNIHLTKMEGLYVKASLVTFKWDKYVPFFGISVGYGF